MKNQLILICLLLSNVVSAQQFSAKMYGKLLNPPPKIIRTCCAFGSNLGMSLIPFKKMTDITELSKVGDHVFLGSKEERNGIIYTQKGGFVDLGHLRDIADWTVYLYHQIHQSKGTTKVIALGREGGKKMLSLYIPVDISDKRVQLLAGQIAYDLSNWHEIGTWFGTSFIPFIPERYSAFSPEDQYSNLMGANMGIEALGSDLPYEVAMTLLIKQMLMDLDAVPSSAATYAAMERVLGDWWTREKKLPSRKILIKRYISSDRTLVPWMVNQDEIDIKTIHTPNFYDPGLDTLYKLEFDLNRKFPLKEIFPERVSRCITQKDFPSMMGFIEIKNDLLAYETREDLARKAFRKERRLQRRLARKKKLNR